MPRPYLKVCLRKAKSGETLAVRAGGSGPLEKRKGRERIGWQGEQVVLCPGRSMVDIHLPSGL